MDKNMLVDYCWMLNEIGLRLNIKEGQNERSFKGKRERAQEDTLFCFLAYFKICFKLMYTSIILLLLVNRLFYANTLIVRLVARPSTAEDPPCRGRCTLYLSRLKRPPFGVPTHVSSSSLDHNSKQRGMSPKDLE
ncbi:hypothetical protein TNCV_3988831 [Trichonephila clavipes]|nr:hypothetical protein TNCV_3988831 [Trichonephila clavipes]